MEKADTKKWLDEVKETLFRDRAGDERKDEYSRLEAVIEKHQGLIPRVLETQVKSEVFWKCYEYGDDLIQIFEFIDDQRAKSVRDVIIGDTEATDELIDKHASIMRIMENKKKTVEEFIVKGPCAVDFDNQHCGIYAGDEDSYIDFADVFDPLIMEYHGLSG